MSVDLSQLIGRKVKVFFRPESGFVWEDITDKIKPKNPPEIYSEDFRPINPDEGHCIDTCVERSRFNESRYKALWSRGRRATVSYSCDKFGLTLCVIFCQDINTGDFHIMTGIARLNPIDSFDKVKGQKLAFYRAVTGE